MSINIHRDWMVAPNIHLDPECPKFLLEIPFRLGPNASIGGQGFGYHRGEEGWLKVKPHKYGVVVKAGASLHANVVIDRGSHRDTIIGNNARINSNAFIGHNVQIARGVLVGVGSAISGSTTVGKNVVVWSHAYIEQRCEIGDRAVIGAFSHVRKRTKIPENQVWVGNPAKFLRMRRDDE